MKSWRYASSLIVLAKHHKKINVTSNNFNYDILFQKRLDNASSFPNSVVFPGGVTEESDFSSRWLDYMKSCGIKRDQIDALSMDIDGRSKFTENSSNSRNIGLRITAIRETFEEFGILICTHKSSSNISSWASAVKDFDVKEWQNKVHNNSEEFMQLCQTLECYPNIWALNYWNQWLTPPDFPKRFDSTFFITAFDEVPHVVYDESEVAGYKWATVEDILDQIARGDVNLFPPQQYEVLRMSQYKELDELVRYSVEMDKTRGQVKCPVHIKTENGVAAILPGEKETWISDDLYPKDMDYNKDYSETIKTTLEELRKGCTSLHRMEKSAKNWKVVFNLQ